MPSVTIRTRTKQAKLIQIRRFVGRSVQASAASNRHRRSLFCQSILCLTRPQRLGTDFAISSASSRPSSLSSLLASSSLLLFSLFVSPLSICSLVRKPFPSTPSSSFGSIDHCQGQKLSATIVNVVSRQLERVRVEQNHCHGLQIVRPSYDVRRVVSGRSRVLKKEQTRYAQLPMPHYYQRRRLFLPASMYSSPLPQRPLPGRLWAQLQGGRRDTWETIAGAMPGRTRSSRHQRTALDGWQISVDSSTPA